VAACTFDPSGPGINRDADTPQTDGAVMADAAPPPTADVRFVSVTANVTQLQPGLYGIEIVAVLRNDLAIDITSVVASLSFSDGTNDRAGDFRWRDFDMREGVMVSQPATVGTGTEATYRFKLDALPWAIPPGPILINGTAAFDAGGSVFSATPLDPPLSLDFITIPPPIVVTTVDDENDDNSTISFREAVQQAIASPGFDRIVFDPSEFPPGGNTVSTLDEQNGELPSLDGTGGDLVIDGRGADFTLAVDSNWESPEGRYGLRLNGGSLVISNIGFRDMGYNYRDEGDLSGNNCGASGSQLEGGAIRVDGGTLVMDNNTFADPNVDERNCYAALVRIEGGSGHRVVNNLWTDQSMDSVFIDADTIEVSGNVMNAGSNTSKVDECIYVNTQGGSDLWIVGNLCVDMEYSGVIARGSDSGTLYVVNNTFVRNGLMSLSAVRREQGNRPVVLRNNVYISNNPAAIRADNSGTGFDIAYELVTGSTLCDSTCPSAAVDSGSIITTSNPMVVNSSGSTLADFTPQPGSPLINSGIDWLDRNGSAPGHHQGTGPDRGAVELP